MLEIAPWENPNLSAPFATIERLMEGQLSRFGINRRFSLWGWDGRIVWRDCSFPGLWWATLDRFGAQTILEWETAITTEEFGRARTYNLKWSGSGTQAGFSPQVHFHSPPDIVHQVHVISDQHGGLWRMADEENWNSYFASRSEQAKAQNANAHSGTPSIWCKDYFLPEPRKTILENRIPKFTEGLSPTLKNIFSEGNRSDFVQIMTALATQFLYNNPNIDQGKVNGQFRDYLRFHTRTMAKILNHFRLPIDSELKLVGWLQNDLFLVYEIQDVEVVWNLSNKIPLIFSAHEQLELQLRLRDALKPILTSTEIEEILNLPARP